ncbi:MAG TPA: sigma factor-like helix-turn-helix DNA-binding protein [Candidatus Paceibacterota bacterium]
MDLQKLDNLIDEVVGSLNQRSGQIITHRYGLSGEDKKTLAELGERYDLTRERIRQIESQTLNAIRDEIKTHKEVIRFLKFIHAYLNKIGNVRPSKLLAEDILADSDNGKDSPALINRLHFLADALDEPNISYGDDEWHDVWHNDESAYKTAQKVVSYLTSFKEHDFDKFIKDAVEKFGLPDEIILNYLHSSKNFGKGPYGDYGAMHWIHVNPRTARDKSYLVLKKSGAPLHFREIAGRVNKLDGVKTSHPDTIHNELIKDPRFVLVGRGTYGLRD